MRKVGVFGGTFDPIHLGHLAAAQAAVEVLGLDKLIFVPAGCPPHKRGRYMAPAADRLRMVKLAVRGHFLFSVLSDEAGKLGASFTIDTLKALAKRHQGSRMHLIIGADQAQLLDTWRNPLGLFRLAEVDVITRPGFRSEDIPSRWRKMIKLVRIPGLDISSSDIRQKLRDGRPVSFLMPESVERYIGYKGLYRKDRGKAVGRSNGT